MYFKLETLEPSIFPPLFASSFETPYCFHTLNSTTFSIFSFVPTGIYLPLLEDEITEPVTAFSFLFWFGSSCPKSAVKFCAQAFKFSLIALCTYFCYHLTLYYNYLCVLYSFCFYQQQCPSK